MFCIRTRPNQSPLIFCEDLSSSSTLHNNLHVLMRNGEIHTFPFLGFIRLDNVHHINAKFVKVLYIEAYSPDGEFSGFYQIPNARGCYTVGMWVGDGVKICLYNNYLKNHPLPDGFGERDRPKGDVVYLGGRANQDN